MYFLFNTLSLEMENMVFFLAELGLTHYTTAVTYCPSVIAAAAVYAARCTLNKSPSWTDTLKHYTGYSEDQLRDCAKLLVSYHAVLCIFCQFFLGQASVKESPVCGPYG